MKTATIFGWVVGSVDAQPSVVAAKANYVNSPSQKTEAAYNAAVANAYAAETALTPADTLTSAIPGQSLWRNFLR